VAGALRAATRTVVALLSIGMLAAVGWGWSAVGGLADDEVTSDALDGVDGSVGDDVNLLIMGLDSRLDKNGDPLPDEMYEVLHAGDETVGGYNANVLMLVHLPADGSGAKILAIPRDDYVDLPGCPSGVCRGKIKEAYGLAVAEQWDRVTAVDPDAEPEEHQVREAGRTAQIAAVRALLGGVPIDHFAEVTMAAFYELAEAVAPIPVCLLEDTADYYSGAEFEAGYQELDARQAMAFVRQRRDIDESKNFSDLDRSRRQQAFMISLASRLAEGRILFDRAALNGLVDTAQRHMTFDNALDIVSFARLMDDVSGRQIESHTLPTAGFATLDDGSEVNIVDPAEVRALVAEVLGEKAFGDGEDTKPEPLDLTGTEITVLNATDRVGLAGGLAEAFTGLGAAGAEPGNAAEPMGTSQIRYGPDAAAPAEALAGRLGIDDVAADPELFGGAMTVTVAGDIAGSAEIDRLLGADQDTGTERGTDLDGQIGAADGQESDPWGQPDASGAGIPGAEELWIDTWVDEDDPAAQVPQQITDTDVPCVR